MAAFSSSRGDYTDPVALAYGQPLLVTNQDEQGPTIGGDSSLSITPDEVGLDNECITPATNLSVTWYVNGNKVVETNNTVTTTLNPGFDSTFQLKQSVWLMFGQKPISTSTYTVQTFSRTTEIPVPNGASDLYIEAYTNNGVDTFKAVTKAEFAVLTERTKQEFNLYRKTALLQGEKTKRDTSNKTIAYAASGQGVDGSPPSTMLIGSLEQDSGDVLVIVTATFITALTIGAATYLLNNLLSKFSGGLKPSEITISKDSYKLEMKFHKARTVLALLGLDAYEDAVNSALTKAVTDPSLKGETWTLTETTGVSY